MSCTTHHHACDCREAKFSDLQKEVERLREAYVEMYNALQSITEDGHDDCEMCDMHIRVAEQTVKRVETPRPAQAKEKESCGHKWMRQTDGSSSWDECAYCQELRYTQNESPKCEHEWEYWNCHGCAYRKCDWCGTYEDVPPKSPPSAPKESEVEPHRKLEIAAKMVIAHWHEFGPEHSFEETMHWLEVAWKECQKLGRKA